MNFVFSPEIWRYVRIEAKRPRLVAGFVTMNAIGFAVYLMASQTDNPGKNLHNWLLAAQLVLLFLYGAICIGASVSMERAERTWDFQRLSPLTSLDLAFGKLIGSPVFAYFLFACIVPWVMVGVWLAPDKNILDLFDTYVRTLTIAFFALTASLMISAYNEGTRSGSATALGVLAGFLTLQISSGWIYAAGSLSDLYYGVSVPRTIFVCASACAFGAWAFLAARWRIGEDLLEESRVWRLPAFMVFLYFYIFGFMVGKPHQTAATIALIALPAWMLYIASLANPFGTDHLRRWQLSEPGFNSLNRLPLWIAGVLTLVCMSLVTAGLRSIEDVGLWWALILVPVFAVRDLAFIQWCRFGRSRRPEVMALVYLSLAYIVPPLVMLFFKVDGGYEFFIPYVPPAAPVVVNMLPALAQASLMLCLVCIRVRRDLARTPAPTS